MTALFASSPDGSSYLRTIACAEIKISSIHGWGLFATRDIHEAEILCILDGQIVDWASHEATRNAGRYGPATGAIFTEWNALDRKTLLARAFRTSYGYINHSRAPNLALRSPPLTLVASCDIGAGQELTLDYRAEPLRDEYVHDAGYL